MEHVIVAITHNEVRRHPRWREEINTPPARPRLVRSGARLLGIVAFLIVATVSLVLFLNG